MIRKIRIADIVAIVGDVVVALAVTHDVQEGRHCSCLLVLLLMLMLWMR